MEKVKTGRTRSQAKAAKKTVLAIFIEQNDAGDENSVDDASDEDVPVPVTKIKSKAVTKAPKKPTPVVAEEPCNDAEFPDHKVMNFLISIIHLSVAATGRSNEILGGKGLKINKINEVIDKIPNFGWSAATESFLLKGSGAERKVISEICKSFGELLRPATGDMIIPGLPNTIEQFVVNSSNPKKSKPNTEYTILVHGSGIHFLHAILQGGLQPSGDGLVWMEE